MENHLDLLLGQASVSAKRLLLRLRESLAALLALVPLNLRPTVETGLHHFTCALWHVIFGLLSSGESAKMTVAVQSLPLAQARG
jgi:hypothetical protein